MQKPYKLRQFLAIAIRKRRYAKKQIFHLPQFWRFYLIADEITEWPLIQLSKLL